ncbi:hypothetical protein ALIPUT_01792 [Alistipes putredinis DSM 17216]|uniref:Uncharacterized protein n=1 Tax=Alistipes putredinis DSM 17216 TaxID=445970 RepID=B0MX55_9BACT|nr:hypothetical protein ALIPUT_01792 [Alistipes putredinis DSM 17216]
MRQALFFLPLSGNFRIGANRARQNATSFYKQPARLPARSKPDKRQVIPFAAKF